MEQGYVTEHWFRNIAFADCIENGVWAGLYCKYKRMLYEPGPCWETEQQSQSQPGLQLRDSQAWYMEGRGSETYRIMG